MAVAGTCIVSMWFFPLGTFLYYLLWLAVVVYSVIYLLGEFDASFWYQLCGWSDSGS